MEEIKMGWLAENVDELSALVIVGTVMAVVLGQVFLGVSTVEVTTMTLLTDAFLTVLGYLFGKRGGNGNGTNGGVALTTTQEEEK